MLKKFLLISFISFLNQTIHAQILDPVHWSYGVKKINASEAYVVFKATIDNDWHIYSQHIGPDGPVKTSFNFKTSPAYLLIGKTIEPKPISRREEAFGMTVSYFEHSVIFQQKIKLTRGKAKVEGSLEYMTCNDQKCLPPETKNFSIAVN